MRNSSIAKAIKAKEAKKEQKDILVLLEELTLKIRKRANYTFKHSETRSLIAQYLTATIKSIKPTFEGVIYVEESGVQSYYANYFIKICKKAEGNYQDSDISFYIEELHKNCSSVGIHHIAGDLYNTSEYESPLFTNEEDALKFLEFIKEICVMIGYGNILYTISSETLTIFQKFVEANAKPILEFTSPRNRHKITYYSQLINQ